MNAPYVAGAAVLGWFTFTADAPGLAAAAGVLFAVTLVWAVLVTLESWHVLRRFSRRTSATRMPDP